MSDEHLGQIWGTHCPVDRDVHCSCAPLTRGRILTEMVQGTNFTRGNQQIIWDDADENHCAAMIRSIPGPLHHTAKVIPIGSNNIMLMECLATTRMS